MTRTHFIHTVAALLTLFMATAASYAAAVPGRYTVDLSGPGWSLWRDSAAQWQHDKLFLPGVDLAKLPTNAPTSGWGVLQSSQAISVSVPGTAVEYLGNGTGRAIKMTGVTWWTRKIKIPANTAGRKVRLEFGSVRLRAEVYVNHKLAAYDIVGNTPFEADITNDVKPGSVAELEARITNPGGNFSYEDIHPITWGKYKIPMSHGFGGITGNVRLVVCDPVYIDNVYVQNQPSITSVKIITTIKNTTPNTVRRKINATVAQAGDNKSTPHYVARAKGVLLKPGNNTVTLNISAPDAKIWSLQSPNLYFANVRISGDGSADGQQQTFGFRWFAPTGIGTNAMLRLNGHRIVLRTAISWGFWPLNGIFATPAMAEKQIHDAKMFGLNMLNFHRCIGSPVVLNKADEMGLLYFEEPGGYVSAGNDPFAQACRASS